MTTNDKRADYIAGLRTIADLLDAHDELPLPYSGTMGDFQWIEVTESGEAQRGLAQAFARLIPGTISKDARESYFDLNGHVGGVRVSLILERAAVCTRVVRGTREVTEQVPDPSARVPTITVTKTVEDIEWVCEPVLSDRVAS